MRTTSGWCDYCDTLNNASDYRTNGLSSIYLTDIAQNLTNY